MPFVAAPNIARVALIFNDTEGNEAVNICHFRFDDPPMDNSFIGQLLDVIEAWAASDWATVSSQDWSLVRLEGRDLTTEFGTYVVRAVSIAGDSLSQALPPQNTIAVSLRSIFSGRSRRGRLYHVGLAEGSNDGGYITPAAVLAITAVYEALRADVLVANWTWGVLSYVLDGAPRAVPLFTPYTSVIVTDTIIDSQDKRKPKP